MKTDLLLLVLLAIPAAFGGLCLLLRPQRAVLAAACVGVLAEMLVAVRCAMAVFAHGSIETARGWLFLDALSAYHLVILLLVFLLSTVYARTYFGDEIRANTFTKTKARRFGALWFGALGAMVLVLVSNNLGIMWVGIEATTLLTAFLICIHVQPSSLEATWKYLIMCSVGVAFAFIGTLLVGISASKTGLDPSDRLLWTRLNEAAAGLNPATLKAGFLFILVGYGTKAGLAPMHSWLPDAHSQAPAPVSAVFSGFLLNTALYCILRYIPLVETATGHSGWGLSLMVLFGVVSILVAAAFIMFQHDVKRLLAYHSVEHMGIIALGIGLGGLGTFAGLFHTLNHSLCKTLAFFSAGRLGQIYGTHDMGRMAGSVRVAPLWGGALFASILALIGVAPFALFMSEFQILKSAVDGHSFWALGLFLGGTSVVFIAALKHAIQAAWGEPVVEPKVGSAGVADFAIVLGPIGVLLVLGVWMPHFLFDALSQAAAVVRGKQ